MGYVYLICNGINFKIGVTKNINKRIHELQTGSDNELWIVKYVKSQTPYLLETMLHKKYHNKNVLNEWFSLTSHEVYSFDKTCDELHKRIDSLRTNPFMKFK